MLDAGSRAGLSACSMPCPAPHHCSASHA
jgi:hypothetical protein